MKLPLIAFALATLSALPSASAEAFACHALVRTNVELSGEEFSLADLFTPDSCPALLHAAAGVHLGRTPLPGSVRVLSGNEVRDLLRKLAGRGAALTVPSTPDRIVVRRAGTRASCADIGDRILPASASAPMRITECGAEGRIAREAALEVTRKVWEPAVGSWKISARCIHPSDCVPFLVRMGGGEAWPMAPGGQSHGQGTGAKIALAKRITQGAIPASTSSIAGEPPSSAPAIIIARPGESMTLIWDQDGIRLLARVICLDPGEAGQVVRARLTHGRVVRAVVVSAGMLRATS